MKNRIKNSDLEKRIFISYFFITFFLIILLLLIAWQVARWGINLYEKTNMEANITDFDVSRNNESLRMLGAVNEFTERDEIINATINKDTSIIDSELNKDMDNLTICDRQRNIWYGIQWDLIDKYLPQIYQHASQNQSGSFVASYGKRFYLISYSPCLAKTSQKDLLGIFIVSKRIELENFNLRTTQQIALFPFDEEIDLVGIPEIESYADKITHLILEANETLSLSVLTRLNMEYAVAMTIFYDLQQKPSGVFLVCYRRYVNEFVQQSMLIFLLILLAFTLVIVSFFGNWFSRSILAPVKNVSTKMNEIASNPADLEILEKQYTGVLGDMVDAFNVMNIALAKHSKSLSDYKIITDNIQTGIFWLDDDFNIQLCNPSFLTITDSLNMDYAIGENLNEIIGLKIKIRKKISEGNNTFPDLKIKTKTGSLKYIILNIREEFSNTNIRYFGTMTDISKEHKAIKAKEALELELIKSNKLAEIGRNVEGIVHNLNSPLNSILGYSQLIKKGDKKLEDVSKIIDAGKIAAQIVKGLLDKVKRSSSSMIQPIDVNELIEQELELCNHNLFFKHYVILEKDMKTDLPKIGAIYGDISLCIANILNNAFDAMKDSVLKNLYVRTRNQNGAVCIEIEDTGCGITPANFDQIFEAYFSTKKNTRASGFGLGLAISKNIIDKYKGEIMVNSLPDKGSKFTIILPGV
jgi:signal transduction histidine kinase